MSDVFAARIADPEGAMSAVRKYANIRDEKMQILVEASVSQLRGMRVPDGESWSHPIRLEAWALGVASAEWTAALRSWNLLVNDAV